VQRPGSRLTALAVLLGVLLTAGCSLLPPSNGASQTPSSPASTSRTNTSPSAVGSATPTASSSASTASPSPDEARPTQKVPAVKPPGFVDPPEGTGVRRYLGQSVEWSGCDKLECANVRVPLDWSTPDGQAITLKLGKLAATKTPRLGSLFVNPGGPGGSGVGLVGNFPRAGLEQYDIVGWDPRGSGGSTPVVCQDDRAMDEYYATDYSPDDAVEDRTWMQANRAFGRSCLARSGALLQHISTLDTVKDLDFLRQLLGDDKLNFFGYSYGTELGAVYAHTYPKNVGKMALDGAVNITDDDTVTQAIGFDRSLGAFAEWCADKASCTLGDTKDEVLRSVVDLLDDLDAQPIPVGDRMLTQSLGANGLFALLYYDESVYDYLASSLITARKGDGGELLAAADSYNQRNKDGSYNAFFASFLAISCTEEGGGVTEARRVAAKAAQDAPTVGKYFGVDYVCPQWPVAPAPDLPRLTAKGAAPIVVIGTTGDPATPYEYAQAMAKQLDSGVLVTLRGEGHGAYGDNTCINQVVTSYFSNDDVPGEGTTCR